MKNEIIALCGFCLIEAGTYQFSPALALIFLGSAILLLGIVNASDSKKGQ